MRKLTQIITASLPGPRDLVDGSMCLAAVAGFVLCLEWVLEVVKY